MGLLNSLGFLHTLQTYRVCHIAGRYGGGKTSLAFRLAYELVMRYGFRHVLSNVASVWCDKYDDVRLREGRYADSVIVLDEGGLYLRTGRDVETYLAFLRKLNLVLIIPSVQAPSARVRALTVQRMMNLQVLGLDAWIYRMDLFAGNIREKEYFVWRRPSEIYGLYDTSAIVADDGGLEEYVQKWSDWAAGVAGYSQVSNRVRSASRSSVSFAPDWQSSLVDAIGGQLEGFSESAETIASSVSLLSETRKKRRN